MTLNLNKIFISLGLLIILSQVSFAQPAIDFDGTFSYRLNSPTKDVFVLTPDNRFGIALTAVDGHSGFITSFDPIKGTKFDTELVGFGPVQVDVIATENGYRVVGLITQGGPRAVKIFDMDQNGIFTFRAQTQLTTSSSDSGSNMVLSQRAGVGFVVVSRDITNELVSFSLDNGSILSGYKPIGSSIIKMFEDSTRRIIAIPTAFGRRVTFVDAANPSQLVSSGQVILPGEGENFDVEFTADGNYLFVGGSELSVVNTSNRQIVSSLTGYGSQKIRLSESNGNRTLAIFPGASFGVAVINANDLSNLQAVNQINFTTLDPYLRDLALSRDGKRLFLVRGDGIKALSVPGLTTVWENRLPVSTGYGIKTFGQPERVIAAWESNNNFTAKIYSMPIRTNRHSNFDADSKTDLSVFRPSTGMWYWLNSSNNSFKSYLFGQDGDIPVASDYDGDGQTDFGVYRPSNGVWYIFESSTNSFRFQQLGSISDIPAQADYDGDGKTDIAVFSGNPNVYRIIRSSDGASVTRKVSGARSKPVRGDYDRDGKDDFAVFYSSGQWQIINSSNGNASYQQFGQPDDIPLSGDWDNDGKYDLAVFRPSDGTWYIQQSYYGFRAVKFGVSTDIPVPADYDGDGNIDIAVFRPSNGTWYMIETTGYNTYGEGFKVVKFGLNSDMPVTSKY